MSDMRVLSGYYDKSKPLKQILEQGVEQDQIYELRISYSLYTHLLNDTDFASSLDVNTNSSSVVCGRLGYLYNDFCVTTDEVFKHHSKNNLMLLPGLSYLLFYQLKVSAPVVKADLLSIAQQVTQP